MKTIEMIGWPVPVWSASKLDESRQVAANRSGGGFGGFLSHLRLTVDAGKLDDARQELDTFRQSPGGRALDSGDLRQIVSVALLMHDERSATYFLGLAYPTTVPVAFAVIKNTDYSVMFMRIVGRKVTFLLSEALFRHDHNEVILQRFVDVYPILACFFESSACVDGTVAVNLGDAGDRPGLTFCGNRPGHFLIPDSIFMDTHGYAFIRQHFTEHFLPWAERSPIAFWRGSTTGLPDDPTLKWRSLPRIRLCEIGARNPDLIDAGITKVGQIDDPTAEAWLREAGLMRAYVPPELFQQYKYQIDIDGNTTSWPGLFMKLLTGSVILKVPPRDGYQQWYYDRLRPWINFIPLASDMSDLADKVRWLRENDVVARTIGEAGLRLAGDLTYAREVQRAARTVSAAVKDASAEPILDFDFAIGGTGTVLLRDGWMPPGASGVDPAGYQSRIDLPRPVGIGGFILRLDVSPVAHTSQSVTIAINGQVVAQRSVAVRDMIHLPLARSALANNAEIALTLLYPSAAHAASADSPCDPRLLGIRLHRIAVLGSGSITDDLSPDLSEAVAALRRMDDPEHPHDLTAPPPPAAVRELLLPFQTCHGTLAYADLRTGRLRHGPADTVPHNLFLAMSGQDLVLLRMTPSSEQRWMVRLRPEGHLAAQANRAALSATGHAERFRIVESDNATFAIGAAGMVLCAEPSGDLRLARVKVGDWERFRTTTQGRQTGKTQPLEVESLANGTTIVPGTNRPNWPLLQLSDHRLQELRAEMSVAERNPLLALTTQVKLLASAGSLPLAHKLLRVLDTEFPIASINQGMIVRLVTAAIIAHDPECAVSWMEAWLSPPYKIMFEHESSGYPPAVVQMQVKDNELCFQFSEGLFRARTAEMLIGRWVTIFELFDRFMKSPDRVDGRVAISLDDGGSVPGLAFCDFRPGYYLIPDPHYMALNRYNDIRQELQANPVGWEERAPVAFWRGTTTGRPSDPALGWRSLPRVRLCEIAAELPTIIDAGIVGVSQICEAEAYEYLKVRNLLRPRVARAEFNRYRYQIDIDGNTSSWDGLVMKLLTGGPVLKVRSSQGFEQWFYGRLKPWVNFVPVESDMADLAEKVAWLRANDDAARTIGEEGRKLAEALTSEQELSGVMSVIAAAIRTDAGGPITDLRFAAGSSDNRSLGSGRLAPTEDGVECSLLLPKPPGLGDFVLLIETSTANPHVRFMTVVVEGETLLRRSIIGRTTAYCLLPRSVAAAGEGFSILLRFSNGGIDAPLAGCNDDSAPGVTVHRVGIAAVHRLAWDGYPDIAALLAELNSRVPSSVVHDFGLSEPKRYSLTLPQAAKPRTVYTFFGTILYADLEAGRIRHGKSDEVPHNLFLVRQDNGAVLVHANGNGGYVAVGLRPEGPHAPRDHWIPWTGGGVARGLTMAPVAGPAHETFGLKGAGLFACAEHNGEFSLSRLQLRQWEQFSFEQMRG